MVWAKGEKIPEGKDDLELTHCSWQPLLPMGSEMASNRAKKEVEAEQSEHLLQKNQDWLETQIGNEVSRSFFGSFLRVTKKIYMVT